MYATIDFSLKTLQLMIMYHPTKSACTRIKSSVDMVKTSISDYMSPNSDFNPEDKQAFHMTLWHIVIHHHTYLYFIVVVVYEGIAPSL